MKKILSYILIIGMIFTSSFTGVYADDETASAEEVSNQEQSNAEKKEVSNQEQSNAEKKEVKNIEDLAVASLKIGDKFKINNGSKEYTVVEEDTDEIYLDSLKSENIIKIKHFEVSTEVDGKLTWRKYINLSELCGQTGICEFNEGKLDKEEDYNKEISIARRYNDTIKDTIIERDENNSITNLEKIEREVYYTTYHEIGTETFVSNLYISNSQGINPLKVKNPSKVGKFYEFGDNISEKFDNDGRSTLVDVESFIDSTNQVYISLRFLSEALGCRVDWLAKKGIDNKDADAVLIRFYDSDSYCKKLEVYYPNPDQNEFPGEDTISTQKMYDYVLNLAKKYQDKDLNVDINYSYWDDNKKEIQKGTTKWLNIYLSGNAFNYTDKDSVTKKEVKSLLVEWNNESPGVLHFYRSTNDENYTTNPFASVCNSNNDKELTTLEGCVDVTGIFKYYGVPIPIRLLSAQADEIYNNCDIDKDTYEMIEK